MNIIELKEVTKAFGKKAIIDNISLNIEEGDILGLIGQSGSGKTTLLNLISGFYHPSEGKVLFQNEAHHQPQEVHKNISQIKKNVGFASQLSSFYPKLTVKENIAHFGKLYGIKNQVLDINVNNLLSFTELNDHQNKLAEHISVGMQKRLDLSCSLIHKPKLLILDEPTADLDPVLQNEILHLIKQANQQGITIIIASHHLHVIEKICNKVALIHQGKLLHFGTIKELKKPYLQKEGTIYLDAGKYHQQMLECVKHLPVNRIVDKGDTITIYSSELQNTLYNLINLTQKERIPLEDLDVRKPSLQDVFEKIIQEKK